MTRGVSGDLLGQTFEVRNKAFRTRTATRVYSLRRRRPVVIVNSPASRAGGGRFLQQLGDSLRVSYRI